MIGSRLNLRALDALRGVLAIYVLLGHCRWLLWAGHSVWMAAPHRRWMEPMVFASATVRYGHEAVMVFYVLSGFFIHLRAANSSVDAPFSSVAFYRRRAHRVVAPYLFALGVTVVLDMIGRSVWPPLYAASTGDPLIDAVFKHSGYSWRSIVPALAMLPTSLGYMFGSNGPLWSLGYEVVYYAAYPAWLALRRRSMVAAYGVVPIASVAVAWVPMPPFPSSVLEFYPVWLAGAAVAEVMAAGGGRLSTPALSALFGAGFGLHISGVVELTPEVPAVIYGTAAVMAFATMRESAVHRWPLRALEYLGARSYSIYIVHFPFVMLMSAALFAHGGRPLSGWMAIGGTIAALAFGCLCYAVCERHFIHHRVPQEPRAA
jgi:peptidoglycan/LPS O-acetylase OafA/YrhL